jgi:predicted DNA-binding WGR domain protein
MDNLGSNVYQIANLSKSNGYYFEPYSSIHWIIGDSIELDKAVFSFTFTMRILPISESGDGRSYMVFNRWGRVGVPGQDKLHGPFTKDRAISEFEGKFYDKTKNYWSDRKNFTSYPRLYTWLEMDYGEDEKEGKKVLKLRKLKFPLVQVSSL